IKEKYELHHGIRITDGALVSAATLSNRYITDRFLPDKAIDLIDEASSRLRMQIDSKPEELDELDRRVIQLKIEREALRKEDDSASKDRLEAVEAELADLEEKSDALSAAWHAEKDRVNAVQKLQEQLDQAKSEVEVAQRKGDLGKASELMYGVIPNLQAQIDEETQKSQSDAGKSGLVSEAVTDQDVASIVSRWTGVPVDRMLEGERAKLLRMEDDLRKSVVGQEAALKAVSNAVRRARAGLQDPNRPIGSFLFLGPTGVGKTELTKALARFLFDDEKALLRVDMSEFMEKHAVARLIGAPPGYVGYEEGGVLTEAVRRRPYQVILFDEVEKAHEDVFNILLQVLDDGRLTDGQGRTVDFRNTIIVLTSNLGSDVLAHQPDGESTDMVQAQVMKVVREHFRPEFLNRLDEIILFSRLQKADMTKIVDIQMRRLQNLLDDRKITLTLDDLAHAWLANEGYDPVYGARPLKRVIQRSLQNPLAELLLQGTIHDGENVKVSANGDGLLINGQEAAAALA
ncbi:Clp protease ClpB, partial [Acetobacter malorum]